MAVDLAHWTKANPTPAQGRVEKQWYISQNLQRAQVLETGAKVEVNTRRLLMSLLKKHL